MTHLSKGPRQYKFTILGVEAPAWQDAETLEYKYISSFRNAVRRDGSAAKMGSYIDAGPKPRLQHQGFQYQLPVLQR